MFYLRPVGKNISGQEVSSFDVNLGSNDRGPLVWQCWSRVFVYVYLGAEARPMGGRPRLGRIARSVVAQLVTMYLPVLVYSRVIWATLCATTVMVPIFSLKNRHGVVFRTKPSFIIFASSARSLAKQIGCFFFCLNWAFLCQPHLPF